MGSNPIPPTNICSSKSPTQASKACVGNFTFFKGTCVSEKDIFNWQICQENQREVDSYIFPKLDPNGLSQCIYCGGSGKQTAIKTKKE
jgi:hypothetical protein